MMSVANEVISRAGGEIAAIMLETLLAEPGAADRCLDFTDLTRGVGYFLEAAWELAKLADDNRDGGRAARYASLLRSHAEGVETLG